MKKVHLLTIDPQRDFCDPNGALFVGGADKDMERLANFINKNKRVLSQIHVTLDSHQVVHIAHPVFTVDEKGKHLSPFTEIKNDDVKKGRVRAFNPGHQGWLEHYTNKLEENARYPLYVWPVHCIIGSWGASIYPCVEESLRNWADQYRVVDFVAKGSNPLVEHYSAVMADVEDHNDIHTKLNVRLCQILADADEVLISGEALSHCVANTVRDIANNFGEDNIKKMTLLEDCSSNVTGLDFLGENFVKEMIPRGMKVCKSTDWSL